MGKAFSLLWITRNRLHLIWSLLQDQRIPIWQKALLVLPLTYIFSPLNFITLTIPVLGQVDDAVLLLFAMDLFENVVDQQIVAQYKES